MIRPVINDLTSGQKASFTAAVVVKGVEEGVEPVGERVLVVKLQYNIIIVIIIIIFIIIIIILLLLLV